MSLPEWKSFVLQQVAYINKLSIPIDRVKLLLPLPQMGRVKLPDNVRKELDLIIYEYAEYSFEQIIKVRGK